MTRKYDGLRTTSTIALMFLGFAALVAIGLFMLAGIVVWDARLP